MADPPRPPNPEPPSMPRWVKVSGIVVIVVVVVVVVVLIVSGGEHGPSRHVPEGGNPGGGHTPLAKHSLSNTVDQSWS